MRECCAYQVRHIVPVREKEKKKEKINNQLKSVCARSKRCFWLSLLIHQTHKQETFRPADAVPNSNIQSDASLTDCYD